MASKFEEGSSPRTPAETSAMSETGVPVSSSRVVETDSGVLSLMRGEICETELPKTVTTLRTSTGARVYLVGTAHYSPESCEDAAKTVQMCQPDILMLEICESRSMLLQLTDEEVTAEATATASLDLMWQLVEQKGALLGSFQYLLTLLTRRLSARLGRMAGGEFRAGYQEAKRIPHCRTHLGDRPIQVTLVRLLRRLTFFQKLRLFFHIIHSEINVTAEEVEEYKNKDLLEQLLSELGKQFPTVVEVLVDERDRYMAYQLQCLCRERPQRHYGSSMVEFDGEAPVLVAVVGIGHIKGISQYFHERISNIRELSSVPPPQPPSRAWRYAKRGLFYSLAFYGVYRISYRFVPVAAVDWMMSLGARIPRPFGS